MHRVNGSHHGLARVLHRVDDGVQVGLTASPSVPNSLMSAPPEKHRQRRDDDGFDGGIGVGPLQTGHNAQSGWQDQAVDGRVRLVITAMEPWTLYSAVMLLSLEW